MCEHGLSFFFPSVQSLLLKREILLGTRQYHRDTTKREPQAQGDCLESGIDLAWKRSARERVRALLLRTGKLDQTKPLPVDNGE